MTKTQLLQKLRECNRQLRSSEVEEFFSAKSVEVNEQYFDQRTEIKALITELENAQLANIAANLEKLSPELESGITNLNDKFEKLNNSIAILKATSDVLGLVTRVLALFG